MLQMQINNLLSHHARSTYFCHLPILIRINLSSSLEFPESPHLWCFLELCHVYSDMYMASISLVFLTAAVLVQTLCLIGIFRKQKILQVLQPISAQLLLGHFKEMVIERVMVIERKQRQWIKVLAFCEKTGKLIGGAICKCFALGLLRAFFVLFFCLTKVQSQQLV